MFIYGIWTVPLEEQGGQLKAGMPEQFLRSSFDSEDPSFSPDGRWLAYGSNESGKDEVYVRAFPPPASGQGGKWQISNSGGRRPRWSRNGHELIYQTGDQIMAASYAVKGDAFVPDKPRVSFAASEVKPDLDSHLWTVVRLDAAPRRNGVPAPIDNAPAPEPFG